MKRKPRIIPANEVRAGQQIDDGSSIGVVLTSYPSYAGNHVHEHMQFISVYYPNMQEFIDHLELPRYAPVAIMEPVRPNDPSLTKGPDCVHCTPSSGRGAMV